MAKYKFERACVYCDNKRIGNIKNGCIYEGDHSPGSGRRIGNVKAGCVYEGDHSPGSGTRIGNVKNGYVYSGNHSPGSGNKICKVSDVTIPGIEREYDEMIVAVYHFLIKKFL